jgi:enterochelin esterase-like enzyme
MKRYIVAAVSCVLLSLFPAIAQTNSQVKEDSVASSVLGVTRKYTVYLPESYARSANKTYPVLYLLHGHSHRNNGWVKDGQLQEIADQNMESGKATEMIIITPDAGSIRNGYFDTKGWDYETFFFKEFIPHVEAKYRISRDKCSRAIAGFSMGGGGAVAYAIKHPEMFTAVYAMSALMSLPKPERRPTMDIEQVEFGRSILANDCVALIAYADEATLKVLRTINWFVDCGDEDFLLDTNIRFYMEMKKAEVPCEFRVRDGDHDWEYWRSALSMALPFVSSSFKK